MILINGQRYECEPAVEAYIKDLQAENEELKKDVDKFDQMCFDPMNKVDELKAENARLEEENDYLLDKIQSFYKNEKLDLIERSRFLRELNDEIDENAKCRMAVTADELLEFIEEFEPVTEGELVARLSELEEENARLEEGYQKSLGVIAATDCAECKRHYEGEIKVRCWENKEKNKLIDELNTELSGYRQNAIVFKPELMYTLKECEPKLEEWHNENPSYQNLQEIRYRAAKAEYDKIMKVLNGWGIKTMWNGGADNETD